MNKGGSAPAIPKDYTITLGGGMHIDSDLDNIHIAEIAPINTHATLAVTQPIITQSNSDSKVDLKLEPLTVTTDATTASSIDLKPVAVDSCQTIRIAPLPPVRLEQPWSQHFGITFLGVELFGFNTSGRFETLMNDPAGPAPECGCGAQPGRPPCNAAAEPPATREGGGIRVRIDK